MRNINYSPRQIRYRLILPYYNYSNTMNNIASPQNIYEQKFQKSFSGIQIQNNNNNNFINNSRNISNTPYLTRNYSTSFINNQNIQRINSNQILRTNSPVDSNYNLNFNNLYTNTNPNVHTNANINTNQNVNANSNNSLYTIYKRPNNPNANPNANNSLYSIFKKPNNPNIFYSPQRIKNPNINQELFSNLKISKTNKKLFHGPNISPNPNMNQMIYQKFFPNMNYNNIIIQNQNNNIKFNLNQQYVINNNNKGKIQKIEKIKIKPINLFGQNTPTKFINKEKKEKINKIEINNNISIKNNEIIHNISNIEEDPKDKFDPNEFLYLKRIGEGTYGKIYMVQWKKNNKKYAMKKEIIKGYESLKKNKEKTKLVTNFIKNTGSKGVIKIFGDLVKKKGIEYNYYVLMEIAEKDWEKELFDRQKYNKYYTEKEMFIIMNQLIKTLSLLQKNHITHRDIKPQNILISNGIYKISDFGEARTLVREGVIVSRVRGTELYMSPILFNGLRMKLVQVSHNTFKSDVFSLGMCIFFAASLTLSSIYSIRELSDIKLIKKQLIKYLSGRYSYQLINIVNEMLQIDENYRPDFITLEKKYFP